MKVSTLKSTVFILFVQVIISPVFSQNLTSTTNLDISLSWSQEPQGYTFPVEVFVPTGTPPQGGFPVCVLLHGNGGNGPGTLGQFTNVFDCHILIAPSGYQNSWNICGENSDGPDVELISTLITNVQAYQNVDSQRVRILGFSNGAALANRMYIENDNSGIDIICPIVSHLNVPQYHSNNFYKPSGETDPGLSYCGYDSIRNPLTTRKYLSISNDNDNVIPYNGGSSVVGVDFLHAETAAYTIAMQQGYQGSIIASGNTIGNPTITEFAYLNGKVVHIKGDAMHGTNSTQLSYVKEYFGDCQTTSSLGELVVSEINAYPNPTKNCLTIQVSDNLLGEQYALYGLAGNHHFEGSVETSFFLLDVQDLSAGIYFLKVEDHVIRVVHE